MKLLLTISEAMSALGVGRTKVYDLLDRREITGVKIDDRRLITVESVQSFVERLKSKSELTPPVASPEAGLEHLPAVGDGASTRRAP